MCVYVRTCACTEKSPVETIELTLGEECRDRGETCQQSSFQREGLVESRPRMSVMHKRPPCGKSDPAGHTQVVQP